MADDRNLIRIGTTILPAEDEVYQQVDKGVVSTTTTTGTLNTWLADPTSANLRAAMTDETGTGSLVFADSPILSTPTINSPALSLSSGTNAADGRIAWDPIANTLKIGDGAFVRTFSPDDGQTTLTNKTITSPTLTLSSTSSTTDGRISWNPSTDQLNVGDGAAVRIISPDDKQATLTNKTLTSPIISQIVNPQTGTTYTFLAADASQIVTADNGSPQTFYIETDANLSVSTGTTIRVIAKGAGSVTIQATTPGTTTVLSKGAVPAQPVIATQYSWVDLVKLANNLWYVIGDVA